MGFISPSTHTGDESPRPTHFTGKAIQLNPKAESAFASRSHAASYGAAHRFSQPLSDLLLSIPPCHFQTGDVHGVHPSGN
jgi:hypothetical protein